MTDGFDSFLQQASAQLGGLGSSTMSAASSGLSTIGTGISNVPGYLSTLTQQAYQPQPQLAMQRSSAPSNLNLPTTSPSSGGFGSGVNMDIFGSMSNRQAPSGQNMLSGFGSWLGDVGNSLDRAAGGSGTLYGQKQQLPVLSQAKQEPYISGGPVWTNKQVSQPSTMSSDIKPVAGSLSVGKADMTLPAPGTTSVFMGEGKGQREVQNAKLVIDEKGGSFGVYTTRPAREGFTPREEFGFQVAGGGQGAAQSGQFSTKAGATPIIYNQWNQELAPTANKEEAAKILANPQLYSRLGAEAYGGKVQLLDKRKLGISDMMGRYAPDSGNLANLVDPFGSNRSKLDMANEKIPYEINWKESPTIQMVSPSPLDKTSQSIFTNLNPVTSVGPKLSMASLFGTQKPPEFLTTWEYKTPLPKNYDGTDIPSLDREKVYTQTVNPAYTEFMKTYVPPQYIAVKEPVGPKPDTGFDYREVKMVSKINPEWTSYQSKILTPDTTPLVNVNIPVVTTPMARQQVSSEFMLPEDVISVNAGTSSTPGKSVGENVRGWLDSVFIGTKLPGSTPNKPEFALIPSASAADQNIVPAPWITTGQTGGSTLTSPVATPVIPEVAKPNNWFFGMDLSKGNFGEGLGGIGTMVSSTLNPQAGKELSKVDTLVSEQNKIVETQFVPVVNKLIESGAKVTDSKGNSIGLATKDNVAGIKIEYDDTNKTQKALNDQLTGIGGTLKDQDVKIQQANAKYEATAKDEEANALLGLTTRFTKKAIPEYEEGMGGFIDTSSQAILKKIRPDITDADIKAYYQRPGNLTMTEMLKTYGGGEKGYTKDVFDPVSGKMVKQTFTAPEGVFRDVIYPFSKGFIENPRERPVEFITFAAMPGVFGAVEQTGAKLLTRAAAQEASPLLAKIGTGAMQSTALKTGYSALTTGILANMIGQEAARVKGSDFSVFNVFSGKPIYSENLIVGYDKNNEPIYADKSVAAQSGRAGEMMSNLAVMGLVGNPVAERLKMYEGSPSIGTEKRAWSEQVRSSVTNAMDLLTADNKQIIAKLGASEGGIGARQQFAKDVGSISKELAGAAPAKEGEIVTSQIMTPTKEIISGTVEPVTLAEADTTIAKAALKAATGKLGEVYAILKGSPAADTQASKLVQPGTEGGIRTSVKDLLKDLDIEAVNPVKYVRQIAKIATEDYQNAYKSQGFEGKVQVEPYYPEGYIGGLKVLGPKNPYNVEFKISVNGVQGRGITEYGGRVTASPGESVKIDQVIPNSKLDLKLYGIGSPRVKGEGVFNYYNFVRTPNYEQAQPFTGIGTYLFGSPTMRSRTVNDIADSMIAGGDSTTGFKVLKLEAAKNEKWDNIITTLKTSTREGKKWNEEVPKLGKSIYDYVAISKEQMALIDSKVSTGALRGKDISKANDMKATLQKEVDELLSLDAQIRPAANAKVQTIKLSELYKARASDIQAKVDASGRPYAPDLSIAKNPMQQPFVGGVSATGITGAGVATIKVSTPSKIENVVGKSFTGKLPGMTSEMYIKEESPGKVEAKTKTAETKISKPASISSGVKIAGISTSPSAKVEKSQISASAISSKIISSIGKPSEERSKDESKSPDSGSGRSSYSSISSYSSLSSLSSPSSSGSSSGSSASSMGSKSSYSGGSAFGAPFLAPGGGGGGGGGRGGHLSTVIKNPLAELRVASAKAFKGMFDFRLPNKLAGDVSKNLKQTQPYGTTGASGAFSRGASSSLQEAMNIGTPQSFKQQTVKAVMRKVKKSKPKIKSRKKKGTYK